MEKDMKKNSLGNNTGVGSHSLLQGIFPTQGSNEASNITGRGFTIWATREVPWKKKYVRITKPLCCTAEINTTL